VARVHPVGQGQLPEILPEAGSLVALSRFPGWGGGGSPAAFPFTANPKRTFV